MDKKNVKKLIEYITKEPTEDEHKRGHKYPFMSAEILNAEINKVLDFFLISDAELEMKDKILKNIDNDLSFSDEFPEVKPKGTAAEAEKSEPEMDTEKTPEESQAKVESEEFVDVVEENSLKGTEKNESKEIEIENSEKDRDNSASKEVENEGQQQSKATGEEVTDNSNNDNHQAEKVSEGVEADKKEEENSDKENNNNDVNQESDNNNKDNNAAQAAKAEEPSDRIELLEFLLEFIDTEVELNYVLAGYFSKFFIALLNRNSGAVCFYLNFEIKIILY